jgi:diphthamide biosynthesis methyltransferase
VGPFSSLRAVDFGPPMHALVMLAPTLHFEEDAALERYRVDRGDRAPEDP